MSLTPKVKQQLKGKAHSLKPIVLIGNKGFTDAVKKEIDHALDDHELIKIRISSAEKDDRRQIASEICSANQAELVQLIGHIGVFYRKNIEN